MNAMGSCVNATGSSTYVRPFDAAAFAAASFVVLLLSVPTQFVSASGNTITVAGVLTGASVWSPSTVYEITSDLTIPPGSSLTILPGTIVKLDHGVSIINQGALTIGGVGPMTTVTSITDDSVGGDTNGDGDSTSPSPSYWGRIETDVGATTTVDHATIRYSGYFFITVDMFLNEGGLLDIKDSDLSEDSMLINNEAGTTTISGSSLTNSYYGVFLGGGYVDARNNWWGDASGPSVTDNPAGAGPQVSDGVLIHPWLSREPCTENCNSNVLFIPGIESSRLYDSDKGETQLWEPNGDALSQNLALTPGGQSIRSDIYTRDIVDKAYGVF